MTERDQTIVIPGPYGKGHPDYEVGFANGASGKPAADPQSETYMSGYADGYRTARRQETTHDTTI